MPEAGQTTEQWKNALTVDNANCFVESIAWLIDDDVESYRYGSFSFEAGHSYRAYIHLDYKDGYQLSENPTITLNGYSVGEGVFAEITSVYSRTAFATTPFSIKTEYTVTLPKADGCMVTPEGESQTTVAVNGTFSFSVSAENGYHKCSDFCVKANDVALTADENSIYSLTDVKTDTVITVEGVHKLTAVPEVKKTCTTAGKEAYWHCENCNTYYSDEMGATIIAEPIDGYGIIPASHQMEPQNDLTYHWRECADCGEKTDKKIHADADKNGICDVCNFTIGTAYEIYIANPNSTSDDDLEVQITDGNSADVLGDGTVFFDPATFTLTLNGYDNKGYSVIDKGYSVLYGITEADQTLTICLIGTNNIITPREERTLSTPIAFIGDGTLIFTGTGTLNVEGLGCIFFTPDELMASRVEIHSGAINLSVGDPDSTMPAYGIVAANILLKSGNLNITSASYGIVAFSEIEMLGGNLTISTKESGYAFAKVADEGVFAPVSIDFAAVLPSHKIAAATNADGTNLTDYNHEYANAYKYLKVTRPCAPVLVETIPATCENAGVKEYYHCDHCGKNYENEFIEEAIEDFDNWKVLPALGHSFGDWIAEVPATTEAAGTKAHKDCLLCNKHFDANDNEIANLVIAKLASEGDTPGGNTPGTVIPGADTPGTDPSGKGISDGNNTEEEGLSGGAIAGIAIGSVAVAGIGGLSLVWFAIKKKTFAELIATIKGVFKK